MQPIPFLRKLQKQFQRQLQNYSLLALSLLVIAGEARMNCPIAQAVDQETLLLLTDPLKPNELEPRNIPTDGSVTTPDTISQTGLTPPSLWWARDQFGGDLLSYWYAFSGADGTPPRVDLLVNEQVWTDYNYLQRYVFINQFGRTAKDFGYSTRVFNSQGELLGAYICPSNRSQPDYANPQVSPSEPAFPPAESSRSRSPICRIFLNPYGQGSFRGGASPFGALQPTGGGTGQ